MSTTLNSKSRTTTASTTSPHTPRKRLNKRGTKPIAAGNASGAAARGTKGGAKSRRKLPAPTAATADRHDLYQRAVQNVETEIDFVDDTFRKLRGRRASLLREDFCGTANTSCEWVRRRETNRAVGVDIDPDPMNWGREHNLSKLTEAQRRRVTLKRGNVLRVYGGGFDAVLAMNFSYWCLMTRADMLRYFRNVKRSLKKDGVFFLDFYGGSDAHREMEETRKVDDGDGVKFDYIWDQAKFNPVTGQVQCYIHFKFKDGTRMNRAFGYQWRLWTLPEIRDVLRDAGFRKVTTYLEGDDGEGGGDGNFKPSDAGEADDAFICYLTAEK